MYCVASYLGCILHIIWYCHGISLVVIYWDIMVCSIVLQFRNWIWYLMPSYNILYRWCWVSCDIIMAWLHTIWSRDLCSYHDSVWCYGVAFHITCFYYCRSLAIISKFWHIIWYCNLSIYLYNILYYIAYDMASSRILYDVIMAYHWSSFLVNGAPCNNTMYRFIYNLYNIMLHNPWAFFADHWLSFVSMLWHLTWHFNFSIHRESVLYYIS